MHDLSGAAFWGFIAAVVVAGIWREVALRRESETTIRMAIEKGQPLDPAVIDKMFPTPRKLAVEGLLIAGGVTLATGIGLPLMGYFIARSGMPNASEAFYPLIGSGVLVSLIGIALLVLSSILNNRRKVEEARRGTT